MNPNLAALMSKLIRAVLENRVSFVETTPEFGMRQYTIVVEGED